MSYEEIIAQVASETGLPKKLIDRTYKAYWRAIREHITSLPLKEDLTDEEFNALQPNINIPSIGKFSLTLENYKRKREKYKRLTQGKEDVTHKED